jgi:hypothetical protein
VKTFLRGVAARLGLKPRPPARGAGPRTATPHPHPQPGPRPGPPPGPRPAPPAGRHLAYSPQLDGRADPGEIVWTYVAYEDLPDQGKDRPVLVVGRDGSHLLGLMLSSNSERQGQHNWYGLGPGDWDRENRPSWIRLDRVLTVAETGIRREGAVLDKARFEKVAKLLRSEYGWR